VFGSLFLEEEIKSSFDSFFLRLPRIKDLNFILVEFQDFSECLFLPQDLLRQKGEFLFGQFKEFFPAGGFDLDLAGWSGREISVFVLVVTNEEKLHGVTHFSISHRVGARFVSYRINISTPVLPEWEKLLLSSLVQEIDEEGRTHGRGDDPDWKLCWREERAGQEVRVNEKDTSC